jgi:hypothetical protein
MLTGQDYMLQAYNVLVFLTSTSKLANQAIILESTTKPNRIKDLIYSGKQTKCIHWCQMQAITDHYTTILLEQLNK